jgi:hypothetical protein
MTTFAMTMVITIQDVAYLFVTSWMLLHMIFILTTSLVYLQFKNALFQLRC